MKLENKVAVVTGGTRGIGRAITEAFLLEGASVVVSGRDATKGAVAIGELTQLLASNNLPVDRVHFVPGDARLQADTEALIDESTAKFGQVDILVNNAGGSSGFALIGDLSDDAWNEANNWVLNSTFWASRRVLNGMKDRGFGRIINISSLESKTVQTPMAGHYSVFKAAVNALGRAITAEYGPYGITANSICPGAVETDLMKTTGRDSAAAMGISYEEFLDSYAQQTLTKKINTVDECAAVAVLLASNAGAGIAGTTINVDGGTSPF